jgi:hypothetical protein
MMMAMAVSLMTDCGLSTASVSVVVANPWLEPAYALRCAGSALFVA